MCPLFDEINHLTNGNKDTAEPFNAFFAFKTNDGLREKTGSSWIGQLWLGEWHIPHGFELIWDLQQLNALKSTMRFIQGNREHWPMLLRGVSVIYQWHWHSREVPADWKLANIIPVFKKDKKEDSDNYNSVPGKKIWRRLFWDLLKKPLKDNAVIY